MRNAWMILIFLLSPYGCVFAQSNVHNPSFMRLGLVEHHGTSARVLANAPRPVLQAMRALEREYGWAIDYEDPLYYSRFDLKDDTDPDWRAANPNSKGVVRVAGGAFQSEFAEPSSKTSSDSEEVVLRKVVDDYNASANPGKFVVSKESEGRFAIIGVKSKDDVGVSQPKEPILDTRITISSETRTGQATLNLILQTLSDVTHQQVVDGSFSANNLWLTSEVKVGGQNMTARSLLVNTIAQLRTSSVLVWTLFFDPDSGMNVVVISPAGTE